MSWVWIAIGVVIGLVVLWRALVWKARFAKLSETERLALLTLQRAKKLVVLVVGVTVIMIGIIMLVTPGPGLVVIPIGLAVLATEFVWARSLLRKYKNYAGQIAATAGNRMGDKPRPLLAAVVIAGTLAAFVLALTQTDWPRRYIISSGISMLASEGFWVYSMYRKSKERAFSGLSPRPPEAAQRTPETQNLTPDLPARTDREGAEG